MMRVTQNDWKIYDEGPPIIYGITGPVNEVREQPVTFFLCHNSLFFIAQRIENPGDFCYQVNHFAPLHLAQHLE